MLYQSAWAWATYSPDRFACGAAQAFSEGTGQSPMLTLLLFARRVGRAVLHATRTAPFSSSRLWTALLSIMAHQNVVTMFPPHQRGQRHKSTIGLFQLDFMTINPSGRTLEWTSSMPTADAANGEAPHNVQSWCINRFLQHQTSFLRFQLDVIARPLHGRLPWLDSHSSLNKVVHTSDPVQRTNNAQTKSAEYEKPLNSSCIACERTGGAGQLSEPCTSI